MFSEPVPQQDEVSQEQNSCKGKREAGTEHQSASSSWVRSCFPPTEVFPQDANHPGTVLVCQLNLQDAIQLGFCIPKTKGKAKKSQSLSGLKDGGSRDAFNKNKEKLID